MNQTEALQVLTIIATPFNREITGDLLAVWYSTCLRDIDLGVGLSVAEALLNESEFMPTPAAFRRTLTAMRVAERRELPAQPALPERSVTQKELDRAEIREIIAEMKSKLAALASTGTRGHWHGGSDPCPVCGGINPRVLQRMPDGQLR